MSGEQGFMKTEIPAEAERILQMLNERGMKRILWGGCVRDMILGRQPEDWDITTNALPAQVKSVFRRTVDTGIQHGTVTVMMKGHGYEVTTYRIDGEYSDGRHPDSVAFTPSLAEDLKRRDFTINAMAYNRTPGLVDLFAGREDLKRGINPLRGETLWSGLERMPCAFFGPSASPPSWDFPLKRDRAGDPGPGSHAWQRSAGSVCRRSSPSFF